MSGLGIERIIEGVATSPRKDSFGDIVCPLGARFELPLPLLVSHKRDTVVGLVEEAEITEGGIQFKAWIGAFDVDGETKSLCDAAWLMIERGIFSGVSIGFVGHTDGPEVMPCGGKRWREWSWTELSLVSTPANLDATITRQSALPRTRRTGSK